MCSLSLEDVAVVDANALEDPIAVKETVIEDRDLGVFLGYELSRRRKSACEPSVPQLSRDPLRRRRVIDPGPVHSVSRLIRDPRPAMLHELPVQSGVAVSSGWNVPARIAPDAPAPAPRRAGPAPRPRVPTARNRGCANEHRVRRLLVETHHIHSMRASNESTWRP